MTLALMVLGLVMGSVFLIGIPGTGRHRQRRHLHVLWCAIVAYPVLFAVLDNRSVYLGPEARLVDQSTLSAVNLGFAAGVTTLCLGVLALAWTEKSGIFASENADRWWSGPLLLPLSAFLAASAGVTMLQGSVGSALAIAVAGLVLLTLVVAGEHVSVVLSRAIWLWRTVIALGLLLALVLPQWAFVPYPHEGRTLFGLSSRLIGLTPAPNYLAMFAACLFFLEFVRPRVTHARLSWLWVAVSLLTCVWSQGRTAYFVIAVVAIFSLRSMRWPRMWSAMRVTAVWALAFVSLIVPLLVATAPLAPLDAVLTGRVQVWEVAIDAIADHPLVGYGPGVFGPEFWEEYARSGQTESFSNAHNQWLDVLISFGVIGAIGLLWLVWALLIHAWRERDTAGGMVLMTLVLLFGQFPFGTPLRLSGLSWNLLTVAVVVAVVTALTRERTDKQTWAEGRPTAKKPTDEVLGRDHDIAQ